MKIIEAALSGQPRSEENMALVNERFVKLKEMQESGTVDTVKEQSTINELAVMAAQWVSAQTQMIKHLELKVNTVTALMPSKPGVKQNRITESRGAANLRVFSGDKKEFTEWIEKLINQFTVTFPGTHTAFREMIKQVNAHKKVISEYGMRRSTDMGSQRKQGSSSKRTCTTSWWTQHQVKQGSKWKVSHRVKE